MRALPILSLVMFVLAFYGIGAFTALVIDPRDWPQWLRLVVATGAMAGWVWDMHQQD